MNSSQKLGLTILILISVFYVYFSFFNKDFKLPDFMNFKGNSPVYNPLDTDNQKEPEPVRGEEAKDIKIFVIDKSGNLRSVYRTCEPQEKTSCFEYAIKELVKSPSKWEKSKGFTSEIPQGTKVLSVRESSGSVLVDLSSEFESGGGAESTYMRIKQVIKTANANTASPVYLYINGKQVNVIGGEGVMIKQPLNERSLDE